MKKSSLRIALCILGLAIGLLSCDNLSAQEPGTNGLPPTDTLYKQIIHMDSVIFGAYNNKKPEIMKEVFDKSLEFYHDKGGLSFYQQNIDALTRIVTNNADIRRELVPGSTEIYPIAGYGAIQIGRHRFCHTENGKLDCGTFKFLHIWQWKENKWTLTRIVSYDHG